MYACEASNTYGIAHHVKMIIVTDADNGFDLAVNNEEIVEKTTIQLTCKASHFNYTELNWYWRPINSTNEHNLIRLFNESNIAITNYQNNHTIESNLTLSDVGYDAGGDYFCNASTRHVLGEVSSLGKQLIVESIIEPSVSHTNMDGKLQEIQEGKQIRFYCRASGRPRPKITWYKNQQRINLDQSAIVSEDNDQVITIRRLFPTDTGLYECRVKNIGTQLVRTKKLRVVGSSEVLSPGFIILVTVFIVVGGVFFAMAVFLGKRVREGNVKSRSYIVIAVDCSERRQKRELEFFSANLFDQGQLDMFNPDMPLDEQVDLLPYDRR